MRRSSDTLTEDRLFGEKDHAEEIRELEKEKKLLNGFLVHKGLAGEYIVWKRRMITNEEE